MKHILRFSVDNQPLATDQQFLTGEEIKKMAHVPLTFDLYLVIPEFEDELIENDKVVNMARPGIERFISRKPKFGITIIVNAEQKIIENDKVSYDEIVHIAFPSITGTNLGFTVSYSHGPEQNVGGLMSKGSIVFIKQNMVFDVTATHKS